MYESLLELWRFRPLILEFVRRDIKLRYKNSIGGIAWSLLPPLMQIAAITIMLKFITANPVQNYSAQLFVLFLWNYFTVSLNSACDSLITNAPLIRKIYFPRLVIPLSTLLHHFFHFLIGFIFTIAYFFILGAYPHNLRLLFLLVIPTVFFTFVLCLGLSLIVSYLNVFYEDIKIIVGSLLGLFLYLVPIIYPIERVLSHGKLIYTIYMLNPISAFMVTYQRALLPPPQVLDSAKNPLPTVTVPWGFFSIACAVSLLVFFLGFYLFNKYQWEVVERL
ncbi:MAG: ABC transporter permease, partial [Abditibacteriaceae bacterium]